MTHGPHKQFLYWAHNRGIGFRADLTHGPSSHQTVFRNHFLGTYGAFNYGPVWFDQWNLSNNLVANVLGYGGMTGYARTVKAPTTWNSPSNGIVHFNYNGFDTTDAGGRYADTTTVDHGNVTYESGSPSITWASGRTHTLTNCYFYGASRPSWWGTNLTWLAYGPDVSGYTNMIPAQWRYLYGTNSF